MLSIRQSSLYKLSLILLITGFLVACDTNTNNDEIDGDSLSLADSVPTNVFFTGRIKELINDETAIVLGKLAENNPEGEVFVDLAVNTNQRFKVGDQIKVEYDGEIRESYPAQINTLSVELVEE